MLTVLALYKFAKIQDTEILKNTLLQLCKTNNIYGTILIAHEGINGTVSGSNESIKALTDLLESDPRLQNAELKYSTAQDHPFHRLKIQIKKEIVTIGLDDVDPTKSVGEYVNPEDWNNLISQPDVVLIDVRNDYEVRLGSFQGALNPETKTFREFPDYVKSKLNNLKNKKIAMCCTGGIRCEKASSFMRQEGFNEVYHLKGGILKYLETIKAEESLWNGECFVFDQRVGLRHNLEQGSSTTCYGCKNSLTAEDLLAPEYQEGISCIYCFNQLTETKKARLQERSKQIKLARSRNMKHIGARV